MGLFSINNRKPEQISSEAPIKFRYLDPPAGYEKQEISEKAKKAVRSVRERLGKGTLQTTPANKGLKDLKKALKKPSKKKKK